MILFFNYFIIYLSLFYCFSYFRLQLEGKIEVTELLATSQDATDELLRASEERNSEIENELREVLTRQKLKEKDWEQQVRERNEKERVMKERERVIREELSILSMKQKTLSEELNGSQKGETLALSLLKQREAQAERERWDAEGIVRRLKRELHTAHTELEMERERSRNYSLLSRTNTYYPLTSTRLPYTDLNLNSNLRDVRDEDLIRGVGVGTGVGPLGHIHTHIQRPEPFNLGVSPLTETDPNPKSAGVSPVRTPFFSR